MCKNQVFAHLNDRLPGDIARRKAAGDLSGALRLIDARLASGNQPELAPRLLAERIRLERLRADYPYAKNQAIAMVRAEWPDFSEKAFEALEETAFHGITTEEQGQFMNLFKRIFENTLSHNKKD